MKAIQQLYSSVLHVGAMCSAFVHIMTTVLQTIYNIMVKNMHFYYVNGKFFMHFNCNNNIAEA